MVASTVDAHRRSDPTRFEQAKELVEGAPKVIKKDVKKEEAEKMVAKLKEVGAVVELV